jgi:4-hydroxybenzoate polyprenyltransferase
MLAGVLLALPLPVFLEQAGWGPTPSPLFPYLLVGFGFLVGIPVGRAIGRPEPAPVQAAVKRAVLGLVVLDAVLATGAAGTIGLLLLIFLPPALFLGRWIYST